MAAACSLGKLGGEAAVPALRRAARDADEFVRAAAAWSLDRIGAR
jgi:HEAT repeat protein